jgi:hypothetical protein
LKKRSAIAPSVQFWVPELPKSQLLPLAPVQVSDLAPPVTFSLIWLGVERFRVAEAGRELGIVGSGLSVTVPPERSRPADVQDSVSAGRGYADGRDRIAAGDHGVARDIDNVAVPCAEVELHVRAAGKVNELAGRAPDRASAGRAGTDPAAAVHGDVTDLAGAGDRAARCSRSYCRRALSEPVTDRIPRLTFVPPV